MTREEARKILTRIKDNVYCDCENAEAFDMAIEALSAEAVQGVGRYENAMQKLREMPRYLNGVKAKHIKKIPSEIVEVVRCQDCKHWKPWECSEHNVHMHEDDFCSFGESLGYGENWKEFKSKACEEAIKAIKEREDEKRRSD